MTDGRTDGGDCNIPIAFFKKKHGDKKTKLSMLIGRNLFPNKIVYSTMSTFQETVYRNDSVLFNLHESCFTTSIMILRCVSSLISV